MQRSQSIADILLWIFFTPFPDLSTLPFQWVTTIYEQRCSIYLTKQSQHNQHNPSREQTFFLEVLAVCSQGSQHTVLPTLQHFTGIPERLFYSPCGSCHFLHECWGTSCNHVAVRIQADWNELINIVSLQIFITPWQVFSVSDLTGNAIIPVKDTGD